MLNKLFGIAENASEHGFLIDHMLEVVHWFMLILFVGWTAFFLLTIYKFHHKRSPKANYHGVKSKASTHAEFGVVLVEVLLLLGFAFPLWGKRTGEFPGPEENPVRARVVGEQYLWSIHYPGVDGIFGKTDPKLVTPTNSLGLDRTDPAAKDDFIARNEVHLPVGRPAILQISSKDVIHSFAVYSMRIAQDAVPGSQVPMWFTPVRTGEWEVICGQLCGGGHYSMKAMMVVESAEDFEEWSKSMAKLAAGG